MIGDGPESGAVMLRLGLQGVPLEEVRRVAGEMNSALLVESKNTSAKITTNAIEGYGHRKAAHEKMAHSMMSDIKRVNDEVGKMGERWRKSLQSVDNITGLIGRGWSSLASIGREVIAVAKQITDTTQAMRGAGFGAGTGTLEASLGSGATMLDIGMARTKLMEAEVNITAQDFVKLTKVAEELGDTLGVDTAQGINALVEALETGRTKSLKMLGIVVDSDAAYRKYADAHRLVAEKLTDEQKRLAMQEAIMEKIRERSDALGESTATNADAFERLGVAAENSFASIYRWIGEGGLFTGLGKISEALEGPLRLMLQIQQRGAAIQSIEASAANWGSGNDFYGAIEEVQDVARMQSLLASKPKGAKITREKMMSAQAARDRSAASAAKKRADQIAKLDEWFAKMEFAGPAGSANPAEADRIAAEAEGRYNRERDFGASSGAATAAESAAKSIADMQAGVYGKMGGKGILSNLMWGEDGPQFSLDQLSAWQQTALEGVKMLGDVGAKTAEALSQAMVAALVGDDDTSLQDRLKNVAKYLAQEAMLKSLMFGAEALAFAVHGNYPKAAEAATTAAMYGGVAVAAGLTARGLSSGGKGKGNAASSSSMSRSSNAGRSASGGGATAAPPITLYVFPGGEAAAGKAVLDALRGYQRQTGQKVLASS